MINTAKDLLKEFIMNHLLCHLHHQHTYFWTAIYTLIIFTQGHDTMNIWNSMASNEHALVDGLLAQKHTNPCFWIATHQGLPHALHINASDTDHFFVRSWERSSRAQSTSNISWLFKGPGRWHSTLGEQLKTSDGVFTSSSYLES